MQGRFCLKAHIEAESKFRIIIPLERGECGDWSVPGKPFNIASLALLMVMVMQLTGLRPISW